MMSARILNTRQLSAVAILVAAGAATLAGCTSSTPVASRSGETWGTNTGGDEQPGFATDSNESFNNRNANTTRGKFNNSGFGRERFAAAAAFANNPDNSDAAVSVSWLHAAAASAVEWHNAQFGGFANNSGNSNDSVATDYEGEFPAEDAQSPLIESVESLLQVTFAEEGSDFDPFVSRDGKWMVYSSTQHRRTPDIYIKGVTSRTVTQLTADPASDLMPSISPDASRIAFCSNRNGWWNIYVMATSGGQAVQLSTGNVHDMHPSWSPDGKKIAFCRLGQTSGRWELWVMDVAQPQIAEFIGYGMFPQWCPTAGTGFDGCDKILFQRGRERGQRTFSLWTIDYKPGSAGNTTEIVTNRGGGAIGASWNPEGNWIVYSTVPTKPATGRRGDRPAADLWITAIDGSGRVNLTGGKHANLMPNWAIDGRVYFVSDRGGQDQLWSIGTEKALIAAGVKQAPKREETASAPTGD